MLGHPVVHFCLLIFQPVVTKSVQEMGKLYPDDLGEKVITRTDIDFVILIKERK